MSTVPPRISRPCSISPTTAIFNLAGEGDGDVMGQKLTLLADAYTPVDFDADSDRRAPQRGRHAFDFRQPTAIGHRMRDGKDEQMRIGRGYDHNFVLAWAGRDSCDRCAARRSAIGPGHGDAHGSAWRAVLFRAIFLTAR